MIDLLLQAGLEQNEVGQAVRYRLAHMLYQVLGQRPNTYSEEIAQVMHKSGIACLSDSMEPILSLPVEDSQEGVMVSQEIIEQTPLWQWLTHPQVYTAFVRAYLNECTDIRCQTHDQANVAQRMLPGILDVLAVVRGAQIFIEQTDEQNNSQEVYRTELPEHVQSPEVLRLTVGHELAYANIDPVVVEQAGGATQEQPWYVSLGLVSGSLKDKTVNEVLQFAIPVDHQQGFASLLSQGRLDGEENTRGYCDPVARAAAYIGAALWMHGHNKVQVGF